MPEARRTYRDLIHERGPLDQYQLIRREIDEGIVTITLNDPESLNSYSTRMTGELRRALREAEEDSRVRVLILTGAGKAFSAGGDLRRMREGVPPPAERYEVFRREFGGLIQQIVSTDKPVTAAVNGYAMGVAFFTVLACDLVIASDRAQFGTAYIQLGLAPLGVSYFLVKTLGYWRAYELCALREGVASGAPEGMKLFTA